MLSIPGFSLKYETSQKTDTFIATKNMTKEIWMSLSGCFYCLIVQVIDLNHPVYIIIDTNHNKTPMV